MNLNFGNKNDPMKKSCIPKKSLGYKTKMSRRIVPKYKYLIKNI